ncbi:LysR family transcriptional regulator [Mesorhizobium marinum]|uniref:LysR family transcriptional regulator n=1 Tax=Mesorhizobium marinum TaxID=3228790 RepID=A0ABV3QZJ9_9HYPH
MVLRRRLPSSNSLFVIEAAARLGSFSRASEELNITQPAVSHAIAALEKHLGQQLFVRNGPRLSLTENGQRLGQATTRAFASVENVIIEMENTSERGEVVTLSTSTGMATHWLMPRYSQFLERFPEATLQFQLMPIRVYGPLNGCDLGLRIADPEESRRLDGRFAPERIMVVGSPAYLEEFGTFERPKKPHTLTNLSGHPVDWTDFTGGAPIDPSWRTLTFSDYSVVIHTALRGLGLAIGWTSVISKLMLDEQLVRASDTVIETGRVYHLVTGSSEPRPLVLAVRDWIAEQMFEEEQQLKARGIA